jgi:3'-5' exoribonuclease
MARRYVNELTHQESVDQIFLVSNKQLRPNRNGNLYLQVDLSDRGGSISGRLWNASENIYRGFEDGDYVRVEGTAQIYQGAMQMIVTHISRALSGEVDPEDFMPLVAVDIDRLAARMRELLRGMKNHHLRAIAECFLMDDELMRMLSLAPAGVKNHHAYHGGLMEHITNLMESCTRVAPLYPALDADLLLTGAFLHDLGKVDELSYQRGFAYTDEGQLIGHLVMAVGMLDAKVRQAEELSGEPIPQEIVLRLKHMIVSHHGEYEYGSPKLPMTLEAVALNLLDNLDAKLHSFEQQMRDDPNVESPWTLFNANLGRKLYKGFKS